MSCRYGVKCLEVMDVFHIRRDKCPPGLHVMFGMGSLFASIGGTLANAVGHFAFFEDDSASKLGND